MSVALGRPLVFRSLLRRTLQRRERQMGNPPLVNTLSSPGAGLQPICLPRSYPSDVPDFNRSSNIALCRMRPRPESGTPRRALPARYFQLNVSEGSPFSPPPTRLPTAAAPRQRQTTTWRIMIPRARINEISSCPSTRHYSFYRPTLYFLPCRGTIVFCPSSRARARPCVYIQGV